MLVKAQHVILYFFLFHGNVAYRLEALSLRSVGKRSFKEFSLLFMYMSGLFPDLKFGLRAFSLRSEIVWLIRLFPEASVNAVYVCGIPLC